MMRDHSYSPPPLLKRKATTAAASFQSLSSDSSTCSSAVLAANLSTSTSIRNDSMKMRLLPKPPPRTKNTANLNFTTPPRSCSLSSSTSSSPSSQQEMTTPRASPPPPPHVRRMTHVGGVHHVIASSSPHRERNQIHDADDAVDSCAPLLTPTRLKQHVHEMKALLKISDTANTEEDKTERIVHTKYELSNRRINGKQDLERFGICTPTNHHMRENTSSPNTQQELDRLAVRIPSLSSPSASSDQPSTYYTPVRSKNSRSCSSGSRVRSSPSSFSSSRSTSSSRSHHNNMMSSPTTASSSTCSRSATTARAEISARLEAKEQHQMHKMRVVNLLNNSPRNNIRRHPNQQHGRHATESLISNPKDRITSKCGTVFDDGNNNSIQSSSSSAKHQHPSLIKQLQEHPDLNHEMLIHPASVDGTIVAAAWHLHGQTGGRKSFVEINSCHKDDQHDIYSVMNTRDIMNVMREGTKEKAHSQGDTSQRRKEKQFDGDATNLSINVMKNGIAIMSSAATTAARAAARGGTATHSATRFQRDAWSTGIAAAVVTGIAARYYKTFFMFPHGRKVLLPIITGALATAFSLITLVSCQFMTISSDTQGNENGGGYRIRGGGTTQFLQVGPWKYLSTNPSYSDGEVCLFYPSHLAMDLPFLVARSTSALAFFAGFTMVLWTSTLMCVPISRGSMNALGVCFALVGILELLTTLIYQSENCGVQSLDAIDGDGGLLGVGKCRPNQDLVFCIASSTLYMASGWLLCASHKISSDAVGNTQSSLPVSGFAPMEVYTWSEEASSSNPNKGILRTVEKCWTKIPEGSTLMATVFVEQRRDAAAGDNLKTTYSIQTEILPA